MNKNAALKLDNLPTGDAKTAALNALVVEDFPSIRKTVVDTLTSINLNLVEASNGIEALEFLEANPQAVNLVFTDLVMPEMDGFELCEEIRRRPHLRHLPIIVISTHRDAHYIIKALRYGADDYLSKPFPAALSRQVIERVFSHV